jgi:hypothetical protein
VVFRATTHADGSTIRHYQVPDVTTRLDEHGYNTWVSDHVPSGRETDLVSVLLIQEVLDEHALILTCCLERRRGSSTGPFHGEPARVTFTGAVSQVRLYRVTAGGILREMTPQLDQPLPPPARLDHLTGEEQAIRCVFGPTVRILDARAPTVLEDLVGLTSIMHLRTPDGIEIDCGLGWHGTAPFVLRANFPRFGIPADLTEAAAAGVAAAAATGRLTTFETRDDANGPVVMARSNCDGTFHLIRPAAGAQVEAYTPGVPAGLLTADQTLWARYAQSHENLTIIDAYRNGRSDNVFMLAGAPDGQVTRHLIDADGTEIWRAVADDTAAAAHHREHAIGLARD